MNHPDCLWITFIGWYDYSGGITSVWYGHSLWIISVWYGYSLRIISVWYGYSLWITSVWYGYSLWIIISVVWVFSVNHISVVWVLSVNHISVVWVPVADPGGCRGGDPLHPDSHLAFFPSPFLPATLTCLTAPLWKSMDLPLGIICESCQHDMRILCK